MSGGGGRTRTDVVLEALGLTGARLRGDRAWFNCPVHEHKSGKRSETMFVRRMGANAGRWYCFSCKKKGGLVSLTEAIRGCDRDEAVAFVRSAGRGFEPPRARVRVVARPPVLGRARFQMPTEVVSPPWDDWLGMARAYLEDRGLGRAQVERYRIGYATWGHYAGRVVFPFLDESGRAGTVSGRTFVDDEPKYKTPPEADHPDLDVLFGEHLHAGADVRVATEGAIDAASVEAATGLPVAALGGSDVRAGHVLSLATSRLVVVATDADPPGDRAARILMAGLAGHARAVRLRLPTDANEMLRRSPDELRARLRAAAAS